MDCIRMGLRILVVACALLGALDLARAQSVELRTALVGAYADNSLAGAASLFTVVVSSDFDGDGKSDRSIFRPSAGVWYSLLSGGGATGTTWGLSTDIDVSADYDGDGKADIAVWRPSNGLWFVVYSSDRIVHTTTWGVNGDIPLAGDVDGDGKADLVIWRKGNGPFSSTWWINRSSGGTMAVPMMYAVSCGPDPCQKPLLADFDGDGKADFVVFVGEYWNILLSGGEFQVISWGQFGDLPLAGDWDGDGKADAGIFRPSARQWLIHKSSGGTTFVDWGVPGDIPVAGDWDGDGRSDYTIWRPSTGAWYTQFATGGGAATTWGVSGDKPIGRLSGS